MLELRNKPVVEQKKSFDYRKKIDFKKIFFHIFLFIICTFMIVPFLWMLSSSLKSQFDIAKMPPVWIPKPPQWSNYIELFKGQPMLKFILNSIKITVSVVIGQLFFSSLAGYAFARIKFKGRNVLFFIYIGTLMIPAQITLIPMYILISRIGLLDTHFPLIVPGFFYAFGVFLMRQFYLSLPVELEEAAEIDGCNPFQTYWRIMMPQVKPALATLGVFTFMNTWNDLIGALIYLTSVEKFTMTLGLALFRGVYSTKWNYVMAGSVISIIPILTVYFVGQKYFEEGITLSGLKG